MSGRKKNHEHHFPVKWWPFERLNDLYKLLLYAGYIGQYEGLKRPQIFHKSLKHLRHICSTFIVKFMNVFGTQNYE